MRPIQFAGGDNGLYELHLLFDHVLDLKAADPRQRCLQSDLDRRLRGE